ncbi:hypothetical protein ACFPRL_12340 [Pseudoclavibacter helvolus]
MQACAETAPNLTEGPPCSRPTSGASSRTGESRRPLWRSDSRSPSRSSSSSTRLLSASAQLRPRPWSRCTASARTSP